MSETVQDEARRVANDLRELARGWGSTMMIELDKGARDRDGNPYLNTGKAWHLHASLPYTIGITATLADCLWRASNRTWIDGGRKRLSTVVRLLDRIKETP